MYRSTARIRNHVVDVRLDDEEDRLAEAICDYTGGQKAVLVRELFLAAAQKVLHEDQCGKSGADVEAA